MKKCDSFIFFKSRLQCSLSKIKILKKIYIDKAAI